MGSWLQANYSTYEGGLAAVMLTLAMLGMGAKLTVKDFLQVFAVPKGFTVGMLLQVVVIPLVAAAMIMTLDMHPGIAVGIALVAAMPGGSASNIFTHLGRGNAALSVAMTCGATLTCLLTTPIVFNLLAGDHLKGNVTMSMPYGDVIREICLYLLVPLIVGMAVGRFTDVFHEHFSKWCIRGSLLAVVAIVVGSVGAKRIDFKAVTLAQILMVVGFSIAAQQVAQWVTVIFRFPPPDRLAIIIEVTIRNTLLALLLQINMFKSAIAAAGDNLELVSQLESIRGLSLFVILFYGGAAMAVAAGPMTWYRKRIDAHNASQGQGATGETDTGDTGEPDQTT